MRRLLENPIALVTGLVVTLLCCFTPVLVVLLALVGLGAAVGAIDYVLMVPLGFFIVALAVLYGRRADVRLAWGLAGLALVGFAVFFGRFDPWLPVLIAVGGAVALVSDHLVHEKAG